MESIQKSHKIIEKRSERQIVEYGPPEELCKEEKPVCPGDETITYEEVPPIKPSEEEKPVCPEDEELAKIFEENVCPGYEEPIKPSEEEKPACPGDEEFGRVSKDLPRTKNQMRVVNLHMKSFFLSFILAVIIFVGVKVAFPEVDVQMIGGMSMTVFFVAMLLQQLFNTNNSCQCHVLRGEECTCHTLFGIFFGILI